MKKVISTLIIMMLLFGSVFSYAAAAEYADEKATEASLDKWDSLTLSKDESSVISKDQVGSTLIKVYNVPVLFAFDAYSNIQELLASKYAERSYYVEVAEEKIVSITSINKDNRIEKSYDFSFQNVQMMNALINKKVDKLAFSDCNVKHVFYLSGETNHQGTAIYYVTDQGDFVYYMDYRVGEYLFPLDDFVEIVRAVMDTVGPDTPPGGSLDLSSVRDLSAYDINSDSFDLNASPNEGKVENPVENANDQTASDNAEKPDSTGEAGADHNDAVTDDAPNSDDWLIYAAAGCVVIAAAVAAILLLRRKKKA